MTKIIETIGVILFIIGIGSADSPNVIIPAVIMAVGAGLVAIASRTEARNDR